MILSLHFFREAEKLADKQNRIDEKADILEDLAELFWRLGEKEQARSYLQSAKDCVPLTYKPKLGIGFENVDEPIDTFWLLRGKMYLLQADLDFDPGSVFVEHLTDDQVNAMLLSMRDRLLAVACFAQYSSFSGNRRMREIMAALYNGLKRYGGPRLKRVIEEAHWLTQAYNIEKELDPAIAFMQRTLGLF